MARRVACPKRLLGLLGDVRTGADIYERPDAEKCRELETRGLVTICKPMMADPDGAKRQPYFGCIATPAGLAALEPNPKPRRKGGRP